VNKEKSIHVVFSNRTDDWQTPDEIYSYLERTYGIPKNEWYDPCPLFHKDLGFDGLKENWLDKEYIYINPPYSNIIDFVKKAIDSHRKYGGSNKEIIFLIPARTDTKYYELLFKYGCEFTFIIGRLKFGNSKHSSTFPSVLVRLNGFGNKIDYIKKGELK